MTNETKTSNDASTGWIPGSASVLLLAVMAVVAAMAIGALATQQPAGRSIEQTPVAVPAAGQPSQDEIIRRVFALQERLSEGGGTVEDWKMLGRSLLQLGRYGEAVGAWAQAAKLAPNDPEIRATLAQLREMATGRADHPKTSTLP